MYFFTYVRYSQTIVELNCHYNVNQTWDSSYRGYCVWYRAASLSIWLAHLVAWTTRVYESTGVIPFVIKRVYIYFYSL